MGFRRMRVTPEFIVELCKTGKRDAVACDGLPADVQLERVDLVGFDAGMSSLEFLLRSDEWSGGISMGEVEFVTPTFTKLDPE